MGDELNFTQFDGPGIGEDAPKYLKKPNPVHLKRVGGPFTVDTHEGRLSCADGYVAYDPMSGHVWPVAADYVAMYYDPA